MQQIEKLIVSCYFALVRKLFLERHWSPEQISNRLKLENYPIQSSCKTIYRAIYAAMFDELSERPVEANNRKSGLLTLVDRKSRFLLCRKFSRLGSKEVKKAMIGALRGEPVHSITPDRGREFQLHGNVTTELGVEFYFPPPHQPWQRGTNTVRENVWVIKHHGKYTFQRRCT